MLKRLIILNSDIYAKADIELNDCDSLQIVGPNNIGKSTLIYALNFLYIIDGKQMTFSGNRIGDKTTFNHYFPSINSSYIIFEIFKKRYYSILVKKNAEGNIDYYKIDSDYKESLYFNHTNEGQQLKKFDSVLSDLSTSGVDYSKFSSRRDVFNFVYQKGKKNNGVVWLDHSVLQDNREISNNFSKIYRYLINSKLIDNKTLKDSLIIADNKENESIEFSKKNQKDILSLLKHNRDIKVIQSIQKNFSDFKELVNQHKAKNQILSEIVYAFDKQYSFTFSELGTQISKQIIKLDEDTFQLNEILTPQLNQLNQKLGSINTLKEQKQISFNALDESIKEIKSFEGLSFLVQSLQNLDIERKEIESQITQIENQKLSSKEIEEMIDKYQSEISILSHQINTYSTQLIHLISDNQDYKEKLNRILSDEITSLSKEHINSRINQVSSIMRLFDGEIILPSELKGKPIPSINELKKKLDKSLRDKEINEKLLPIAKNLEKHHLDLSVIKEKIIVLNEKIAKIKLLPDLETQFQSLRTEIANLEESKVITLKDVEQTNEAIRVIKEAIKNLNAKIFEENNRITKIQEWKIEIEQLGIVPIEYQTTDSLDNLYKNLKRNFEERTEVKYRKERLFESLKIKTETSYASENDFIKFIDSELATLEDKQKSIDGLLKNISTQFAIPCKTLHSKFQEFEAFITNKFNTKIRKIKISDIDSLSIEVIPNTNLISDLKKIMEIRDLTSELIFDDQSDNLNTLNKYLDNQTTIFFKDLFDIKLHLEKKGHHKVVDLKNQIESDGTDKMIRLIIIMSIINQVVINDVENKVVIFIDEIGTIDESNRIEILNFCKENNFIPISAAPLHPYDGFDKYYLLRRSSGKIVLSENNGNVILRKPKA